MFAIPYVVTTELFKPANLEFSSIVPLICPGFWERVALTIMVKT